MTDSTINTSFIVANAKAECANISGTSTKAYTDSKTASSMSSFSEALNSANKNYVGSNDKTSKTNYKTNDFVSKTQDKDRSDTKVKDSYAKKADDDKDKNFDKVDKSQTSKTDDVKNDSNNKVKDKTEDNDSNKNSDNKNKNNSSKDNENSAKDDNQSLKDEKQASSDSQSSSTSTKNTTAATDNSTKNAEAEDADTITNKIIQSAIDSLTSTTATNATAQQASTQATAANQNPVATVANNAQSPNANVTNVNLDVKVSDAAKAVNDLNQSQNTADKTKLQTQTQQILLNLNQTGEKETQQNATNTPTIQVAKDLSTINVGKSANKEEIQSTLNKIGLTQNLIDNTNAKVVNVTTIADASTNMAGQQDASEQGLKLALQQASGLSNTNQATASNADNSVQTTFDKTLTSTQKSQNISDADILSQINNKLSSNEDTGSTKVTMILKPESLGKIHLELLNGKDGLTASMTAESTQVKEALDKNLDNLKNTLNSQGLNVNNVTVKVDESQKQSGSDLQNQNQEQMDYKDQNSGGNAQNSEDNAKDNSFGSQYEKEQADSQNTSNREETNEKTGEKELAFSGNVDYKI